MRSLKKWRKHICEKCKLTFKLVPPGCHWCNAAEVAICTFESHFHSVLAGMANDFPPSLWDKLLPQTEISPNLLCQSNALPHLLACAHLSGLYNYNKMPLVPMVCKVKVHKKADKQGTWAYHSIDGWYLAISQDHCWTHVCHIKNTNSKWLSDTV